ncbi:MAG: uroporphyrinogen-III C-methyltransferase [Gammaproteobacteria bacterium]|nr:MAG: uroporphyrinogen-III C-methyltransferase [Gammaproteobacteria bacterium]
MDKTNLTTPLTKRRSELLTLKAYRLISLADVILYDALVSSEIIKLAKPTAVKIFVGKRAGHHSLKQEEINRLLYRYALLYPVVVRLKGGDPLVFGRGGEELLFLTSKGIEVEIVPGISSILGASAGAKAPLTHRGLSSSFTVISGYNPEKHNWGVLAKLETLVVLMGTKYRREIAKKLIENGKSPDEKVVFVENATTEGEKLIFSTLGEVAQNPPKVNPPALYIIGSTVGVGMEVLKAKTTKVFCETSA